MEWKDLSKHKSIDLVAYIKDYLIEKPDTQLFIGTDSQNKGRFTHYAFVVVLYNERKGGKILYARDKVNLIQDRFSRLWKEIEASLDIAQSLNNEGINKSLLTIDLDFNPDKKYYSNVVLSGAVGWAEGMGYKCRTKPNSAAASYAADMIVKK